MEQNMLMGAEDKNNDSVQLTNVVNSPMRGSDLSALTAFVTAAEHRTFVVLPLGWVLRLRRSAIRCDSSKNALVFVC